MKRLDKNDMYKSHSLNFAEVIIPLKSHQFWK